MNDIQEFRDCRGSPLPLSDVIPQKSSNFEGPVWEEWGWKRWKVVLLIAVTSFNSFILVLLFDCSFQDHVHGSQLFWRIDSVKCGVVLPTARVRFPPSPTPDWWIFSYFFLLLKKGERDKALLCGRACSGGHLKYVTTAVNDVVKKINNFTSSPVIINMRTVLFFQKKFLDTLKWIMILPERDFNRICK